MKRVLVAFFLVLGLAMPGFAVLPDEVLDDPALEQRARNISAELRCLVCQNQSIDDSNAELARDLRLLVRERLVAGDSNDEVFSYVTARYGEFVLLRPVFEAHTVFLWAAVPLVLIIGATAILFAVRRRRHADAPDALSDEERAALQRLGSTRD